MTSTTLQFFVWGLFFLGGSDDISILQNAK